MSNKNTSEIKFLIELDENRVPEKLMWSAKDGEVCVLAGLDRSLAIVDPEPAVELVAGTEQLRGEGGHHEFERRDRAARRRRLADVGGVAQAGAPVEVGPPRRGVEDEARSGFFGEIEIRPEVAGQRSATVVAVQQRERREVGQVNAVAEHQRGFQAAVGEERTTGR